MRPATRASRLGVAMPVEQTVTTVSISQRARPARQRLVGDIDEQRFGALQKAAVRSGQPRRRDTIRTA
jgi:hypothetical protein